MSPEDFDESQRNAIESRLKERDPDAPFSQFSEGKLYIRYLHEFVRSCPDILSAVTVDLLPDVLRMTGGRSRLLRDSKDRRPRRTSTSRQYTRQTAPTQTDNSVRAMAQSTKRLHEAQEKSIRIKTKQKTEKEYINTKKKLRDSKAAYVEKAGKALKGCVSQEETNQEANYLAYLIMNREENQDEGMNMKIMLNGTKDKFFAKPPLEDSDEFSNDACSARTGETLNSNSSLYRSGADYGDLCKVTQSLKKDSSNALKDLSNFEKRQRPRPPSSNNHQQPPNKSTEC
jgi:hypothetical protein